MEGNPCHRVRNDGVDWRKRTNSPEGSSGSSLMIMSCEFHLTAALEGISKFLDEENPGVIGNEPDSSRKTLRSFKIAISPAGELVVFAKSTWLLICVSKWETSETDDARIKYKPNWHGHISCAPGEEITSLLCLPFFSQGPGSSGCADWTCIIVGFSSGCIRFYTERMAELGCSILHEERITAIKSFHPVQIAQQGKHQRQENGDIYVVYKSVICVFNKSQLMQTLHNKRCQLAKGVPVRSESETYLAVDFKKYSFIGQEEVTDACFLGQALVSSFNTFDHLVTASIVGGFHSTFRASPPQTSLIVTSGRRPFFGFHYTLEGGNGPVLTDVALAVASKIKNSVTATLPDWFSFGTKKPAQSEKPKEVSQEYAEKLNCRFGLCDLWRQGESVIVSPDGAFSAVSDSLGRVILVNNATGIAHCLLKGYRDAQCGFLQVQEDVRKTRKSRGTSSKSQPRQGLFLVIYAPKKGVVEIFTAQHGTRVTLFQVKKQGQLLYNPGAQNVQSISAGGFNICQNQVVFISEDGLNEFSIPFHCALAEENSKISRDLHILKKLKLLLKMESNYGTSKFLEEIEKNARELKTYEVRLQAIESMITYRSITLEAFKAVLKVILNALQNEGPEPRPKKIVTLAEATLNLLLLYEFVTNLSSSTADPDTPDGNTGKPKSLSEELRLPQNELDITLKVIKQITDIEGIKQKTTKVAFQEKKSSKLVQFLSCFDFESFLCCLDRSEAQDEKKENQSCLLNFKHSRKENSASHVGEVFYKGLFSSFSSFDRWKEHVCSCCLNPKDLALSLLSFWCSKKMADDVSSEVLSFIDILKMICTMADPNAVAAEYNNESSWWKELRAFIAQNPFTIRGLYAALCCRSVTIFLEQEREFSLKGKTEKKQSSRTDEDSSAAGETSISGNDWETISKDCCQWDILIVQLQDVALLNAVLNLTFKTESSSTEIPFDFEPQSLTAVQLSGTGRVAELVAKWLVQFGFQPSALIDAKDLEFHASGDAKGTEKEKSEWVFAIDKANETRNETLNSALEYLALLKARFPYSLTSSSLLGNMSWEYFTYWFKHIGEVQYLEAAVLYLEAIPACGVKYGISCLLWNTYLEQKFETLAKMINKIGKVPRDKLCVQEIGLKNEQVSTFLKLVGDILKIVLHSEADDKPDFENNREAIWQNSSSPSTSLVVLALSQSAVNSDFVSFQLQLSVSLLMMSSLNITHQKVSSSLFDNLERSSFNQAGNPQLNSHYQNVKLKNSRTEFLKKCITAAIQTLELVENIPPAPLDETSHVVPSTRYQDETYKKWMQTSFELAAAWAVPLDDLRKHQICELYANGFDRLAEEIISSVNDTAGLASRLLVLGGKRLKYLIQDSNDFSKKLTKLSANLSEWLHTLDLESFTYYGSTDDIEVLMRYTAQWLPEDSSDQKLAVGVVESLLFLKISKSS